MRLKVVVVAYGAAPLLARCLGTLGGAEAVLVVDNSSSPDVAALAGHAGAAYLDPGRNLGFAAAVNLALSSRQPGQDVLLLNPDAAIDAAGVEALEHALQAGRRAGERLACVAPAQVDPRDGRPARVVWPFPTPLGAWAEALGLGRLRAAPGFLAGSVLLLASEALDAVGTFDERFFLYAEEADWQRRARLAGVGNRLVGGVVAEHVGGATSNDEQLREMRLHAAQERYVRKWHGGAGWAVFRSGVVAGAALRAVAPRRGDRRRDLRRAGLYLAGPESALVRRLHRPSAAPPRVVHVVCSDAFAGVERYVLTTASGLASAGCEVRVIGGQPERMASELARAGVGWQPAANVAGAVRALGELVGSGQVDVVHAHMTEAELAGALAAPLRRASQWRAPLLGEAAGRTPLVATRHFAARRGSSPAARALGRILSRRVDAQLAISAFVAERVEGSCVVVPPGVPDVDEPSDDDQRRDEVLMVQRLEAEKCSEIGLLAFARSGLAAGGWRLVLAGGGSQAGELRRLAGELGIAGACCFLGPCDDVEARYRRARIFLATRPDEPFGLAVVEAMSHGMPVVAAGGGGHLETVGLHPEAAMFRPGCSDEAAAQLRALAAEPDRRRRYGAELRALQRERFGAGRQVELTLAAYGAVLGRSPGPGR